MKVLYAITRTGACAVPASALSMISAAATRVPDMALVDGGDVPAGLLDALRAITDPRARRGVRHQLVAVLGVAVCAVLAGARSYVAIAEWVHDLPVEVRRRLGVERVPPSETAIRRVLQLVDPHVLDRAVSGWLSARAAPALAAGAGGRRWQAVAVDGKTARGSRSSNGAAVHLLAALGHADGVVLGQRVVDGKSNEITAFAPLLDGIDITGVIVTVDALHTQREHAGYLIGRGAHYLFTVKRNQPKLHARLTALPWREARPLMSPAVRATDVSSPAA